jgi:hypothetical protein
MSIPHKYLNVNGLLASARESMLFSDTSDLKSKAQPAHKLREQWRQRPNTQFFSTSRTLRDGRRKTRETVRTINFGRVGPALRGR